MWISSLFPWLMDGKSKGRNLKDKKTRRVLVDSSVWVSLFARDVNYNDALKIISFVRKSNYIVLLPSLVFVETINTLKRLTLSRNKIEEAEQFIKYFPKINICHTTASFWFNEIIYMVHQTDLKASDLIILAHALKYDAYLYTFDKKLLLAYKKITNDYLYAEGLS